MPPDVPVCVEISPTRGWCTYTISDREFFIDDENPWNIEGEEPMTWWDLRPTLLLVPAPSYAKMKAYIVKTCKKDKCDKFIGSWERRSKRLEEKANISLP
jgi:hypothetical protein